MLDWLRVDNLVLIRSAELELAPGLNVLTGETGAGKTIVAQAVGLLLGGRADPSLVGPAGAEAYVEAGFSGDRAALPEALQEIAPDDEDDLVLARRVVADGRSRALAFGRSCARADLERAGASLLEIVSQHEARRLARPAVQLALLDATGGEPLAAAAGAMATRHAALVEARRALELARAGAGSRERELVELEALRDAVGSAAPGATEEAELLSERDRLRHLDELLAAAHGAAELVNPDDGPGALALAGEAVRLVARGAELDGALDAPRADLEEAAVRLQEAARALRDYAGQLEAAPGRLEAVEARLQELADLRHRFAAASVAELLERAVAAADELEAAGSATAELQILTERVDGAERAASACADELHAFRERTAPELAATVERHLADLGLEAARLEVSLSDRQLGARGRDVVELRLRANPGLPAAPLAQTASGGELSRVALAVRLAAHDRTSRATLVFDEVDAGIGGLTARAVGEKLRSLAAETQVVCITHLAQIAALADRHFRVVKTAGEPSETRIDQLTGDEVLDELARMLGAEVGDADALALAASLRER